MLTVMAFILMKGVFQTFTACLLKEGNRGSLSFGSYELKPLGSSSLMNSDELGTWNSAAKAFFSCCDHNFHGIWVKKHLKRF